MANTPYTLFSTQAAGGAIAATTTPTSLITGTAAAAAGQIKNTIPAGWLSAPGTMINVRYGGTISSAASSQGNLTYDVRIGANATWSGGAIAVNASESTWPWMVEIDLVVRTAGATTAATVYGQGVWYQPTSATAWTATPLPPAAGGNGFDSTVSNLFDLFVTWSAATAGNTITMQWARAVILNPYY